MMYLPLKEVKQLETRNGSNPGPKVLAKFDNDGEEIVVWLAYPSESANMVLDWEVGQSYPLEKKGNFWNISKESKKVTTTSNSLPPINDFIKSRVSLYSLIYQQVTKQVSESGITAPDTIIIAMTEKIFDQTVSYYGNDLPAPKETTTSPKAKSKKETLIQKIKAREIDTSDDFMKGRYEKNSFNDLTIEELEDLLETTNFKVGDVVYLDDFLINAISIHTYKNEPNNQNMRIQSKAKVEKINDDGDSINIEVRDNFGSLMPHIVSVKKLGFLTKVDN